MTGIPATPPREGGDARSGLPAFPYDRPGYAATYDAYYNLSTINRPHFAFECATVERLIFQCDAGSWCDLACGTGLHLRSVRTRQPIRRTGIDRSASMLAEARSACHAGGPAIDLVEADVRALPPAGEHDLVTAFWYGYIHQPSLAEVRLFLLSAAGQVAPGGALLLGFCDPADIFATMPHAVPAIYGAPMYLDAVVWRFTEPWEGDSFEDCIAPHPALICEWLEPRFGDLETLYYPPAGDPKAIWDRKALLFTDRRRERNGDGDG